MNEKRNRMAHYPGAAWMVAFLYLAVAIAGCEPAKESAPEEPALEEPALEPAPEPEPYTCNVEPRELGCDTAPEREWPVQIVIQGNDITSVNPPQRRVCPGDKIRWRAAPPNDFVRWDVAESPVIEPCNLSVGGVLLCDVKDEIESDCYKYSLIVVAGDKAVDPHIIVE